MGAHYRAQHRRGDEGDQGTSPLPRRVPGAALHPALADAPLSGGVEGVSIEDLDRIREFLLAREDGDA